MKLLPAIKSPIKRELTKLTVPIFIEILLIMSLGALDTFMLSRYSDESVAAVGLANQVVTFLFIIFQVINLATTVLCAQCLGARQIERMYRVAGMAMVLNLIAGGGVSIALYAYAAEIMAFMGLTGDMARMGTEYIRIVGGFSFFQALALTVSAILRSNDKAFYPMYVIGAMNIVNIIGNYILIFGKFGAPALGVEGAAITTATCRFLAMAVLFVIVFRTVLPRFPWSIFRRFPWNDFRSLMKIGLPSAGEEFSYDFSQLVIVFFITSLGMEALATRTYCFNVIMYVYLFSRAISHGGAIIIGHLAGAGKYHGAFVVGKYVCRMAVAITLCMSLGIALCGNWIMHALTCNPTIIALGTAIFWIDVLLEIGRPVNIFAVNCLQAAGDVNYPFIVGVVFQWSIAVGLAYLVGIQWGFGLLGFWWMFTLDENVRGIIFLRRWHSDKWQGKAFV